MKLVIPDYYNNFKCIAGKCPDSCCQGWGKIEVDNNTFEKYQKLEDDFSNVIRNSITSQNDSNIFVLKNGKCPFLNEEKLCDIYINEGEDFLCTTCKMYPRFIYEKDDITYTSLAMSCPVVTDFIIDRKDNVKFYLIKEGKRKEFYFDDINFIYAHKEISIWNKLAFLSLGCTDEIDIDLVEYVNKIPSQSDIKMEIILEYLALFYELTKEIRGYISCREMLKEIIDDYEDINHIKNVYQDYYVFSQNNKEIEKEFENYVVYHLYRNHISGIKEEFYLTVISAVSLFYLQATHFHKYGNIDKEMRKYYFQIHSKSFEHSGKMRDEIRKRFSDNNYLRSAVVLLLVKKM